MDAKSPSGQPSGPQHRKRPEMARYKPGMGKILAAKKGDNGDTIGVQSEDVRHELVADAKPTSDPRSDHKSNNGNKGANNSNGKKPDIKVYVPPKPAANVGQSGPQSTPPVVTASTTTTTAVTATSSPPDKTPAIDRPLAATSTPANTPSDSVLKIARVIRNSVQNSDNSSNHNNRRQQQANSKPANTRQKSERNDRQQQQQEKSGDRHEKASRYDKRQRYPNTGDRSDRSDRTDARGHDRSDRQSQPTSRPPPKSAANDRHYDENTINATNYEVNKRQSNELEDNYVHKEDKHHRRPKPQTQQQHQERHNEPNLDRNPPERHKLDKYEDYEDYYNVEFEPNRAPKADHRSVNHRFNSNNSHNTIAGQRTGGPTQPGGEVSAAGGHHRNDGNYRSSNDSKPFRPPKQHQMEATSSPATTASAAPTASGPKRNFGPNKSQHNHRYVKTFEQQIPPRFLKQQQLKKQNEMSEHNQQMHYESQRRDSLRELPPAAAQTAPDATESAPHRGLIRLPNNQVSANDWTQQSPPQQQPNAGHSGGHHMTRQPVNASKPCVAIRPTQHVPTADNNPHLQYTPSSSPDTNSSATVDNYQQLSPYLRSRDEYAIPHFMSAASVENADNSRRKLKPIIEKSLSEATSAENDLSYCHDPQKVEQIRYRIQLRYEHIILNDLRVCAETNIEQRLWKSAFYQYIEQYRRLMEPVPQAGAATTTAAADGQQQQQQADLKTSLHKIIDEASLFFENLLVKMQETYGFVIEKLLAHEYDSDAENYETLKLVSISAQKIYLYLGDLSRYRECETKNSTFVKSKFFYLRAQMLAPKNGRSYNQLALLAMYQNRRLDAVYYYMRSLAASNPFLTARENLLTIFDECRRKYELNERKRNQDLEANRRKRREELESLAADKNRLEIWIRADGTSAVFANYKQLFESETESTKENLDSLSSVDLNKRFVLSFLHTHGKLFSRVGMESFVPVVNQMLAEFHSLLRRSPIPVMSQRLSQLLAINMFAVFHTSLKDTTFGQNCRSLLQEQAIQVTLAMMSLILECAINSLKAQTQSETSRDTIGDDLAELLPTIKLWTDWMSCQKQLWCPPPPSSDFKIDIREEGDIWTLFAKFLTLLTKINVRTVKLFGSRLEGCEAIILPEDTALAGFLPLLGSPQCVQFAQPNYDKEKARTCLRLTAIQYFGDYLCGIVDPYLKYDVENKRFVSLIPVSITPTDESSDRSIAKQINDLDISETETDEFSFELSSEETNNTVNIGANESSDKTPEQMEIEKLWSLQEKLKKAKDRQEIMKQTVDAVLNEENQSKPSRIVIQPRYVVPDTNCYIDQLDKIKRIIHSKYYELIVPLIVMNELNGLKTRGIQTTKPLTFTDDHIGNVGKAAMEAIDYLVSAFNDKSLKLKAITSKGSLLESINFISESITDTQGNSNDDFILSACFHFIKDEPKDKATKESAMNSNESNSIFREVVLLTDDRNLRVKALGRNVPVRGLQHFVKWAAIRPAVDPKRPKQH